MLPPPTKPPRQPDCRIRGREASAFRRTLSQSAKPGPGMISPDARTTAPATLLIISSCCDGGWLTVSLPSRVVRLSSPINCAMQRL